MNAEELRLSESASQRAKVYMESGEPSKACEAYLEAADHMMKFAAGEQGKRKADAQWITEQLLNKAREAKAAAKPIVSEPPPFQPQTPKAPVLN